MNVIKEERHNIASLLSAVGIPTNAFLPERFAPPTAVISASDPYLSFDATTLCEGDLNLVVTLVAKTGANQVETDALDEMLIKAINVFIDNNWAVQSVGQPQLLTVNTATYLSVDVRISTSIPLGGN